MHLAFAFILVLCPIAVTCLNERCCFADRFHGKERLLVDGTDIYYWVDFTNGAEYQTYGVNGDAFNVTDIKANKVYVVTKDGCRTEDFQYTGLYKQCYDAPDTIIGFGDSTFSYAVGTYTTQSGDLTVHLVMQKRNDLCIPLLATRTFNGQSIASAFLNNHDSDPPTPPDLETVKARCS